MPLEDMTGPNVFIDAFNITWPLGSDSPTEGDDHIRGVKNCATNWALGYDTENLKDQVDADIAAAIAAIPPTVPVPTIPFMKAYTADDVYTPTAGTVSIDVTVVGGGGGGGGASATGGNQSSAGSGGGAGGTSTKSYLIDDPGVDGAVITVGAGSAGGSGLTDPLVGGASSFGATAAISATGGAGGRSAGNTGSSSGHYGGLGGLGTGGTLNMEGGGGGGSSFVGTNNGDPMAIGGMGGSSTLGGGARGKTGGADSNSNGEDGGAYGGGGGGAMSLPNVGLLKDGGNGADGVVVITEYIQA